MVMVMVSMTITMVSMLLLVKVAVGCSGHSLSADFSIGRWIKGGLTGILINLCRALIFTTKTSQTEDKTFRNILKSRRGACLKTKTSQNCPCVTIQNSFLVFVFYFHIFVPQSFKSFCLFVFLSFCLTETTKGRYRAVRAAIKKYSHLGAYSSSQQQGNTDAMWSRKD